MHNEDDDSLVHGFIKRNIISDESVYMKKIHANRKENSYPVVYEIVKGKFDQKKKLFTLTTIEIIDLDFSAQNKYERYPSL